MNLKEMIEQYAFSAVEAETIFRTALETATVMGGSQPFLSLMNLFQTQDSPYDRMLEQSNKHPWTMEQQALLIEKLAPLVDVFTFEGVLARISPLLRGLDVTPMSAQALRPCLVNGHRYWFHQWQTRKWVVDPSPMIGGTPGGQCQVTMALVEDQETGQVEEVYPHDVRFLDSEGLEVKAKGLAKDPGYFEGVKE